MEVTFSNPKPRIFLQISWMMWALDRCWWRALREGLRRGWAWEAGQGLEAWGAGAEGLGRRGSRAGPGQGGVTGRREMGGAC